MTRTLHTLSHLPDDLPTDLGPPIPRAPEEKPSGETREQRPDGVVITDAQGRMRFEPSAGPDKPAPTAQPTWPFPSAPAAPADPAPSDQAAPGAHGFLREPLKVGDKVLHAPGHWNDGIAGVAVVTHADRWVLAKNVSDGKVYAGTFPGDWERAPADPKPAPLRVGDRVRSRIMHEWPPFTVTGFGLTDGLFYCTNEHGPNAYGVANEGDTWERCA